MTTCKGGVLSNVNYNEKSFRSALFKSISNHQTYLRTAGWNFYFTSKIADLLERATQIKTLAVFVLLGHSLSDVLP